MVELENKLAFVEEKQKKTIVERRKSTKSDKLKNKSNV